MKNYQKHEAEKRIVKFHIGRGGRFNNPGLLTFVGFSRIDEGDAYDSLFLSEDKTEYLNHNGDEVGLTVEEAEVGIGRIDQDGDYDTTYTMLLSDCDNKELDAIKADDHWINEEAMGLLLDYYKEEDYEELYH